MTSEAIADGPTVRLGPREVWLVLRFASKSIHVDEMSRLLGAEPTSRVELGTRRSERSPPFRSHCWIWQSCDYDRVRDIERAVADLEAHLGGLERAMIVAGMAGIETQVTAYRWTIREEILGLDPSTLLALSRLPGTVEFHLAVYPD